MPDALTISEINKPYLLLQWYRVENARVYEIRKWDGSEWVRYAILEENGSWVYSLETGNLEDETLHQFRVVAIDLLEQESDPLEFRAFVVRPPTLDPATVSLTYTEPNITISQV